MESKGSPVLSTYVLLSKCMLFVLFDVPGVASGVLWCERSSACTIARQYKSETKLDLSDKELCI